jgi:hypothetical protein
MRPENERTLILTGLERKYLIMRIGRITGKILMSFDVYIFEDDLKVGRVFVDCAEKSEHLNCSRYY